MMRWLSHVSASGIVLALLTALVGQLSVVPIASAQSVVGCSSNSVPSDAAIPTYCDQGIAFSACAAAEDGAAARLRSRYPDSASNVEKGGCRKWADNVFQCYVRIPGVSEDDCRADNKVYSFYRPDLTCSSRNSSLPLADAAPWFSAPSTCVGGCKVGGTPFSQENGNVKVYGMKDRYYDGSSCSPQAGTPGISPDQGPEEEGKPKPDECTALGNGQTSCIKPNGDHCATASTGKTFCWKPHESGEKRDGTDAQKKSEAGKPVTPPAPSEPTKEYQRTEGHQQTACINNTCITYNVTNFTETGKGSAKNGTGDNSPDGTKNTSGNGKPGTGSGGGGKDGEGDSASDSGNCDVAPLCTGDTLKCLHLRYTWKNQCNTAKDEVTGGDDCKAPPVCIGKGCKAQEYAMLLQQWRGRCAAEDDRTKLASDAAAGAADAAGDNETSAVADLWKKGPGQDGQGLDRGKLTLGGGELFPAIEIMGTAWAPPAQLYTVLDMIRQMVSAAGVLAAMYILFRK